MLYTQGSSSSNDGGYKKDKMATLMIVDVGFPKTYLEQVKKENSEKQRLQETSGIPYLPKNPTMKEGGIEVTAVILKEDGNLEEFFKIVDGEVVNYNKYKVLRVAHKSYQYIYDKSQELLQEGKRYGYSFQKSVAGDKAVKIGDHFEPVVIKSHPDPNPAQEKNKEKNFKDRISYAELSEEERKDEVYSAIVEDEASRQREWGTILEAWRGLTEEQASAEMIETFSRRLALCNYNEDKNRFVFHPPAPGLVFNAMVSGFNIVPFKWNQDTRKYDHFTAGTIQTPTEETKSKAEAIRKEIESMEG